MKIYIIGICGTFMGGLARLACDLNMQVSGSDANVYPPMSTQLTSLNVELFDGYQETNVPLDADMIVVGNTISRGNPELEFVLEKGLPYTSGAQWLHDYVLRGRWVLGVAGTHGKTTTSSLLAWILQANGLAPGFLIGGVPDNFGVSSRLGETPFFVIEADEYDTAFCDKRSKFVHYQPRTLILNNLEFDHADIFDDLAAIQKQFHHLIKTIPQSGQIIHNQNSPALDEVLTQGCWSELSSFGAKMSDWQCRKLSDDASQFEITHQGKHYVAEWPVIGEHNMHNAVAAIAAAHHVGIKVEHAIECLPEFRSVKRRLELIYADNNIHIYDDFAHHPTAISETLKALRNKVGDARILAILEPRSNTMKQGVHKNVLKSALSDANLVYIFADANVQWDINELVDDQTKTFNQTQTLINEVCRSVQDHDHILIMSNGGFEGLHKRLIEQIPAA